MISPSDLLEYPNRGALKAMGYGHDGVKLLARLRNLYLARVMALQVDWVVVTDADLGSWPATSAFLRVLASAQRQQVDVACGAGLFQNGTRLYDAFAYRNADTSHRFESPADFERRSQKSFFPHALCDLQPVVPQRDELWDAESCFGGFAVYRAPSLSGCTHDEREDDCEHVSLHRCVRSKHQGRVALATGLRFRAGGTDAKCCVRLCDAADQYDGFLPFPRQFAGVTIRLVLSSATPSEFFPKR